MKEKKKKFLDTNDDKVRIGVVGSREYQKIWKIKRALREWKDRFGDNLVVVSGGCRRGADRIVKDLIETDAECEDIEYEEFPPRHQNYNQYCVFPKDEYGEEYDVGNFFERNGEVAYRSDYIFGFIPPGVESNGTKDTLEKAENFGRKTKVID